MKDNSNNFLFIIQFDSFLKSMIPVIQYLINAEMGCDVVLMLRKNEKNWISKDIIESLKGIEYDIREENEIYSILDNNYSVAVIASTPRKFFSTFTSYVRKKRLSTKFASGYIGVMLKNHRGRFRKGVRRRANTHLIWVPGIDAKRALKSTRLIDPEKTKIAATGIPRFDHLYDTFIRPDVKKTEKPGRRVLFIEQPTYPKSLKERMDMLNNLFKLAEKNGGTEFIIKPRFYYESGHTHQPKYYIRELFEQLMQERPLPNITLSSKNIYELINISSLSLTISSTAGLEAILAGRSCYFIGNYCGRRNKYGSMDFRELGRVTNFRDILNGNLNDYMKAPSNWEMGKAQEILRCDGKNTKRLADELIKLADSE